MTDSKQIELANCNFCKTILMLCVVLCHSMAFWSGQWFTAHSPVISCPALGQIADWMGTFHVEAFTIVSGYIFAYLRFERKRYDSLDALLKNKAYRLLIPYIGIGLLWIVPFGIFLFGQQPLMAIKGIFLGTTPYQLWFLLMLFWVFVFSYLLCGLYRKNRWLTIGVALGLYAVGTAGMALIPNFLQLFSGMQYCLYFFIGMEIRRYSIRYDWRVWITICVLLVLNLVFFELGKIQGEGMIWSAIRIVCTMLSRIFGSIMAFIGLQALARLTRPENKLYKLLERMSFQIYLVHQQIIYLLLITFNGMLHPAFHAGINFFGSIIISLIIISLVSLITPLRPLMGFK